MKRCEITYQGNHIVKGLTSYSKKARAIDDIKALLPEWELGPAKKQTVTYWLFDSAVLHFYPTEDEKTFVWVLERPEKEII